MTKNLRYVTLSVRFERAQIEQVRAHAERAGTSPAETIRALLARALGDADRARDVLDPAQIERVERLVEIAAKYAAETSELARISHRSSGRVTEIQDAQRFAARVLEDAKGAEK